MKFPSFLRRKNRRVTSSSGTSRRDALPRGLKDFAAQASPSKNAGFRGGDPAGLALVLCVIGVVAVAALFRVWTRSETQRLGYAIVAAENRLRLAETEHARLTVEEATLSSPIRVAKVAQEKLGLHAPTPDQIVDLGKRTAGDTELALVPTKRSGRMSP